ncbi:hypothetical protein GQ53DRAFT_817609 [Thozetella sp. PMI_491]|nr:hypothetical protein GQ53DRAFT_817609 [Thozetella sp. PMI_491]
MANLTEGQIAAIVLTCSIFTGALGFWVTRRCMQHKPRKAYPISLVFEDLMDSVNVRGGHYFGQVLRLIVSSIDQLVAFLDLPRDDPLPASIIATLREAVPCDGMPDADWPLWERLMTDVENEKFTDRRRQTLQVIITHWLIPKMQPDSDEAMSFFEPDFLSLRKKVMKKPHFNMPLFAGNARAIQQMWSYITMCLSYEVPGSNAMFRKLDPTHPRAPGIARVRHGLVQLLEPLLPEEESERRNCLAIIDDVVGLSSILSVIMLVFFKGEAEFFWEDPKTLPWPSTAKDGPRHEGDQFLIRFPGIRAPAQCYGNIGDRLEEAPEGDSLPLREPRKWLPVDKEQQNEIVRSSISIGGVMLENMHYPPGTSTVFPGIYS